MFCWFLCASFCGTSWWHGFSRLQLSKAVQNQWIATELQMFARQGCNAWMQSGVFVTWVAEAAHGIQAENFWRTWNLPQPFQTNIDPVQISKKPSITENHSFLLELGCYNILKRACLEAKRHVVTCCEYSSPVSVLQLLSLWRVGIHRVHPVHGLFLQIQVCLKQLHLPNLSKSSNLWFMDFLWMFNDFFMDFSHWLFLYFRAGMGLVLLTQLVIAFESNASSSAAVSQFLRSQT